MLAADLQQHERGASDLHRGVRPGEDPRTIGECPGMDEDINNASSMVPNIRPRMRGASGRTSC